ncbi:hypothetical protein EV426DRAFT_556759 [Tirmania nivea]|nr:hypothetical protein EV426DRAFT_556759 [Tirmania nivea]
MKYLVSHVFPPTPPASDNDIFSPAPTPGTSSPLTFQSRKGSISEEKPLEPYAFPLPPPSSIPTKTHELDVDTPDAHVKRDARLIRLTGIHPFNVEAPLTDLFNSGFLTPPELHFVRNHGPVPEVHDQDIPIWEVSIEGLVENPITLTVSEISSPNHFSQYTLPITLVCAGNRRKEQNMVRKSQGFSWGPAGVSTSLWTGPMLCDILALAKPDRRRGARYVCFEGGDKLPNGAYGTSLKLSLCMDPVRGIMLAYKHNGEMLMPDHGRPIRVVVPGMIGGRSVKWLKKIIISDQPSTSYYHYYDNKVMPTHVTPAIASSEEGKKFWMDEKWCIFDLNVNSAIAYPAHDEILEIKPKAQDAMVEEKYTLRGYAYGGGGRRVQRVEISLDKGKTWRPASITNHEDKYRAMSIPENTYLFGGKLDVGWRDTCFCWCFWNLSVPHSDLASTNVEDIVVRAMDEALNIQPRDMYWTLLGMMNNPWFRVALRKETLPDGRLKIRFEHPTQPALMKGGWMERVKKEGGDLTGANWGERDSSSPNTTPSTTVVKADTVKMTNDSISRLIEIDEFRAHSSKEMGTWFVVEGEVYNGTPFLSAHPGGEKSILVVGGTDCTEEFQAIHSETAKNMMPKYHIGTLSPAARKALAASLTSESNDSAGPRPIFLDAAKYLPSKLISKEIVSHDTILLRFALDHPDQLLGLPVGQHIMIKTPSGGKPVIRAYTPISHTVGSFDLLIKVYRDLGLPGYRGGVMSQALDLLAPGVDIVQVKGPVGRFTYLPSIERGEQGPNVNFAGASRKITKFLMVCAGTGITPIYQVLEAVAAEGPASPVRCFVAYGNRNEDDMLCRKELDAILRIPGVNERVKLIHTLSGNKSDGLVATSAGAEVHTGRVSLELVQEGYNWLTADGVARVEGDMMVLACGPEGMEEGVKTWVGQMSGRWGIRMGEGKGEGGDVCIF